MLGVLAVTETNAFLAATVKLRPTARIFFKPIRFDLQLTYLAIQLFFLLLVILLNSLGATGKYPFHIIQKVLLPLIHLRGWISFSDAISLIVFCPLMASSATRALSAFENFLRAISTSRLTFLYFTLVSHFWGPLYYLLVWF